MGVGLVGFGGIVGYFASSYSFKKKFNSQKKELLNYIHWQNDLLKEREKQWEEEYKRLYDRYSNLEKESVERDYEEFKAPDTNNDDMISRAEFNTYVKKYLASFPELSEKDFPKFDDFDLDGDGLVSFDEWQEFLRLQKQQEAAKSKKMGGSTTNSGNNQYADLINVLYENAEKSENFNSLNKNLNTNNNKAKGNNNRR